MDTLKKLLVENQWSRRSPSLMDPDTNLPAPTCPVCTGLEKHGHDEECWLGQAIAELKTVDFELKATVTEITQLRSRVHGLKRTRDALLEENHRFRAGLQAKGVKIAELERIVVEAKACIMSLQDLNAEKNKQISELKSELEGRMDDAHEVVTHLELEIQLTEEAKEDLRIEIIQQSGKIYFWALMCKDVQLAHSRNIDYKPIIEPEADEVAAQLGLPVVVNERK